MRRRFSILAVCATLLMAGLVTSAVAKPAVADDYQYTVRVFPGNRGELSADPVVVKVSPGEDVDLYKIATAKVNDPKYVQTGFRLSGQDKLYGNGKVNGISEDMDFVVAYGVEANSVPYTLRFVESGTGKELAESKTYYGKEGEKPVAAFEYIDGYRPLYLAITGTLHKGEENVWTFEYVPLEEGETFVVTTTSTDTTYNTVTNPGSGGVVETTTSGTGGTGTADTTGTTGTATGGGTAGTAGQGGEGANAGSEAAGESTEPETQEILDLDTPLAGPDGGSNVKGPDAALLTQPAVIASGCLGALVVAGLCFFFMKRRKAKQDEEA